MDVSAAAAGWLFALGCFSRDFFESIDAFTHYVRRNCETHSLSGNTLRRECHFCRANADQPPGEIDHRSAAVAWINRRVRLNQILIVGLVDGDVAFGGAKHSATDRAPVSHCITNYDHSLAQQVWRNIIKIDRRKCGLCVDLDEGEIVLVIACDVMSAVRFAVVGRDMNFQIGSALDHVLVGNDVACRINNETGAETLQSLADFARPNAIIAEKLRVKIFESDRAPCVLPRARY